MKFYLERIGKLHTFANGNDSFFRKTLALSIHSEKAVGDSDFIVIPIQKLKKVVSGIQMCNCRGLSACCSRKVFRTMLRPKSAS